MSQRVLKSIDYSVTCITAVEQPAHLSTFLNAEYIAAAVLFFSSFINVTLRDLCVRPHSVIQSLRPTVSRVRRAMPKEEEDLSQRTIVWVPTITSIYPRYKSQCRRGIFLFTDTLAHLDRLRKMMRGHHLSLAVVHFNLSGCFGKPKQNRWLHMLKTSMMWLSSFLSMSRITLQNKVFPFVTA